MALLNRSGRSGKSLLVAQGPEPLAGRGRRRGPVDNRLGIVGAERPAQPLLGGPIHHPGLVQKHRRHRRQLGQPAANEQAIGIVIDALLDRVVDADRIDAGGARLHLALAPVDSRFVIDE